MILWCGGPLTNVALALSLDPELPQLVKELVLMGAGFNVDKGGNHRINGRREFNWWWDPEAVRMVMSAPWKKITITPVDISVKTSLSQDMQGSDREIQLSDRAGPSPKYSRPGTGGGGFMWDEIAAAAVIDPSIITQQQELQVNIDIDHGATYGQTIFMEKTVKAPPWLWKVSTVQVDLDQGQVLQALYRSDDPPLEKALSAALKHGLAKADETNPVPCAVCSGPAGRRSGGGAAAPRRSSSTPTSPFRRRTTR